MSLLLPDLKTIIPDAVAQAQAGLTAAGITLEDHVVTALVPALESALTATLNTALADVLKAEQPVLERLDRIIAMFEPVCQTVTTVGTNGLDVAIRTVHG